MNLPIWTNSGRLNLRAWLFLVGVLLVGFAIGSIFQIGSALVKWLVFVGGVGFTIPAVWQVVTAERALTVQRAEHAASQEDRKAGRRQARHRMEALADQAYQRAAGPLRTMPDTPVDSWYDWAAIFGVVSGRELRNLFLDLRVAAANAGEDTAETGSQLHNDFMQLEQVVRLISTPNNDPRSPEILVREAVGLRISIRMALQTLGAKLDYSGDF